MGDLQINRSVSLWIVWLCLPSLAMAFEDAADEERESSPALSEPSLKSGMTAIHKVIEESAAERQTLITWLVDQSSSLAARRAELADLIDDHAAKLNAARKDKQLAEIKSAVVAFGEDVDILTPEPVEDAAQLSELIRNITSDNSGVEKTFTAVQMAADKFRRLNNTAGRHNILFVIVTDERGDDLQMVHDVVKRCAKFEIRVFCLGPVAPFGTEKGYIQYQYSDGFKQDIPVDQGPESARMEIVQTPWINVGRISSGFGPFALEVLCRQTQGEFIPFEDTARHRFDPEVTQRYIPFGVDADSIQEIEREVRGNTAKIAVLSAAELTRKQKLVLPANVFRADSHNALRTAVTDAQRAAAILDYRGAELQQALETKSVDRSTLNTPRWQAAFDLAMGRVLASRARSLGYNIRIAQMKVDIRPFEKADSNTWELAPEADAIDSAVIQKLAARSREFLQRVVVDHPGTPFAFVAEQELKYGFGWRWGESNQKWPELKPPRNIKPLLIDPAPNKPRRRVPRARPKL